MLALLIAVRVRAGHHSRELVVVEEGFVYTRALRGASLFAVTNCSPGGPCGARKRSSFSFLAEKRSEEVVEKLGEGPVCFF